MHFGLDNPHIITTTIKEDIGNKYYILNICDQVDLTNGFRYIKEVLLQHHNYKMFCDYTEWSKVGINVYSVKSDAFTIKKEDLELARKAIHFSSDIGGWRLSKCENINIPSTMFTVKNNRIDIEKTFFWKN